VQRRSPSWPSRPPRQLRAAAARSASRRAAASANDSARRAIFSYVEAHRQTAASSSGIVVNIPVTHMIVAAVRWSDRALANPSRCS